MKKRSTEATRRTRETKGAGGIKGADSASAGMARSLTIGLDLGDRMSQLCVLDSMGEIVEETRVASDEERLDAGSTERLGKRRIAMEVRGRTAVVSRLLREMGHEVLVANSRKLRFIYQNRGKTDRWTRGRWRGGSDGSGAAVAGEAPHEECRAGPGGAAGRGPLVRTR